jgi:hypothetical protein
VLPGSNMTVHRIRLRGPWLLEPTAATEMRARTVRVPVRWGELVECGACRVRLSRRFHCPTNLGPDDQVSLGVNKLPDEALVCLNGAPLGPQACHATGESVFPIARLEPNNLLTVEFDVDTRSAAVDEAWGEVALMISSP